MALVVTLGALTINDDIADANSAKWYLEAIEGWDSPDLRMALQDLPGHDRQALGPVFYNARALSLIGTCDTPTEASFWASKAKLMGATNLTNTPGLLTVTETTTKKIAVYRAGRVRLKPLFNLMSFDFEVPLIAPDPRILANTASTLAGSGTATNNGNFKAAVTLTVTGSAAGPIVATNSTTGRTVTVTTSVPSGQQLVIDFRARTILLNGVNRYDLVSGTPQWWNVEPGANNISYSGGGTPSFSWNDSWI